MFSRPAVSNACATLAILNSVFNLPTSTGDETTLFQLGAELENLKEFGTGMDSQTLGLTISNSDKVRPQTVPFLHTLPTTTPLHTG